MHRHIQTKAVSDAVPSAKPKFRRDGRFAALVGVAYLVGLLMVTLSHEMWRDELQAWNIASASSTPIDLLRNMRYEAHPPLWHMCLFVLTRFTANPLAMQLFHVALATGAAYLFLRYAPLSRLKRGLFVFGFFPFYEYGAIARCYSLGLLLTFAFCALFEQRGKRLIWMSLLLFGLAMSSAYGLVIAAALGVALIAAWVIDRRAGLAWQTSNWTPLASIAIVLVGFAVAKIRITPVPDSLCGTDVFVQTGFDKSRLIFAIEQFARAYFYDFGRSPVIHGMVPAIGLFAVLVALFRRKTVALAFFLASTVLLLVSAYVNKTTSIWHMGYLVIAFAVSLWLSGCYPEPVPRLRKKAKPLKQRQSRVTEGFVIAVLAVQVLPNVVASYLDVRFPFSNGKAVATYLRETSQDRMPLAAIDDESPTTISGYLHKPIECLVTGRRATYVVWTIDRAKEFGSCGADKDKLRIRLDSAIRRARGPVVLIACRPVKGDMHAFPDAVGGFIQDCEDVNENYWICIGMGR